MPRVGFLEADPHQQRSKTTHLLEQWASRSDCRLNIHQTQQSVQTFTDYLLELLMPPSQRPDLIDQNLIQALANPLRVKILELLLGQVLSPAKLSRELGVSIGVVAYHLRVLRECGCVELTRQEPRRGATENFYTGKPKAFIGHPEWKSVPKIARGGACAAALHTFNEKAVAAIESETCDGMGNTYGWMALRLDSVGQEEAGQILTAALKRLEEVHEQAAIRLNEEGQDGEPFVAGVAGFTDTSSLQKGRQR